MNSLKQKLIKIQNKLNAPKGQYNKFGKYNYRSCEDIIEGVKPILTETNTILTMSDEVLLIGDRYYIKATATLSDAESDGSVSVSAVAREENEKKGMDSSQLSGSTSSYARKYALNGLFAIDDSKDADTDSFKNQTNQSKQTQSSQKKQETKKIDKKPEVPKDELHTLIDEIDKLAIIKVKKDKDGVIKTVSDNNNGDVNYKKIKDIEVAKKIKSELEKL